MKVLLAFAALLVAHAAAHLCLITPHQRGDMQGLDMAGSKDCGLTAMPCGGRKQEMFPKTLFKTGQNVSIAFQKNLDHFNMTGPGKFVVKLGKFDPAGTVFDTVLLTIPDTNTSSLHVYNPYVVMPKDTMPAAVMQVTYVTDNAPGTFYQCADIAIV